MTYKVVPFNASINKDQDANVAASQLEALISALSAEGFEYVRMETIPTFVAGTRGCFGIGALPATSRSYTVVVARR